MVTKNMLKIEYNIFVSEYKSKFVIQIHDVSIKIKNININMSVDHIILI